MQPSFATRQLLRGPRRAAAAARLLLEAPPGVLRLNLSHSLLVQLSLVDASLNVCLGGRVGAGAVQPPAGMREGG